MKLSIYLECIVEHPRSTGLYWSRSLHQIQQGTGSFRIYRRNALDFRSDKIPHGAGRIHRLRLLLDSRNRLLETSFSSCPITKLEINGTCQDVRRCGFLQRQSPLWDLSSRFGHHRRRFQSADRNKK